MSLRAHRKERISDLILINQEMYRVTQQVSNLGLHGFWLFHCLPDPAWAEVRKAGWAELLGKMSGRSKSK